jgi:hypothetical protein
MMTTDSYIERMSEPTRLALINDYEQFRRDGFIGECVLRKETRIFQHILGVREFANITLWMEQLANAAYRHYAHRYISLLD